MSNYMIEKTREQLAKTEQQYKELLANPNTSVESEWNLPGGLAYTEKEITRLKTKLKILETEHAKLDNVSKDMVAIMSHTRAVEDKYNCRSVKFMFWFAGIMPKSIGNSIRNHVVSKINAPVCSIVGNPKQELPPMPQESPIWRREWEARQVREREQDKRVAAIWTDWYNLLQEHNKPTRWQRFKFEVQSRFQLIRMAFTFKKEVK